MSSTRAELFHLVKTGAVSEDQIDQVLAVVGLHPDGAKWRAFIDKVLLYFGALAVSLSLLFFIAYNWASFGRFGKFALVQAFLVCAVLAYVRFGAQRVTAQATLAAAVIALGVLLALFGQTYQTGADPWQLFATWGVLMLPWAVISSSAAIWAIFILVLNTALLLYLQVFPSIWWLDSSATTTSIFLAVNSVILIVWEVLRRAATFMDRDWAIRALVFVSGVAATVLAMSGTFRTPVFYPLIGLWLLWLVIIVLYYRYGRTDLVALAVACLSGIVGTTVLAARILNSAIGHELTFFGLIFLVVILGGLSARWLRSLHHSLRQGIEA